MQCLYLCTARLVFGWLSDIGKFAGSVPPSESASETQTGRGTQCPETESLANKYLGELLEFPDC